MPKDSSIHKILLIGSGPIVIGQGCEFDYSGVQACKALKEEGYTVILVNSNPATIMTDPEFAHRTYIEPITPEVVEKIIEREKPDALLPTLGGQTALNCAMKLHEMGVLEKYGVRMIGAKPVSSSRTTTLATMAAVTKTENTLISASVCRIAYGAFLCTLPRLPICTLSLIIAKNGIRKKIRQPTQKTGLLTW